MMSISIENAHQCNLQIKYIISIVKKREQIKNELIFWLIHIVLGKHLIILINQIYIWNIDVYFECMDQVVSLLH